MRDLFRDSTIGQWLRLLGGKTLARFPEEHPGFQLPASFFQDKPSENGATSTQTLDKVHDMEEGQDATEASSEKDTQTDATETGDNITVVTWYSDDDPDNPRNWPFAKKMWVSILLLVYTVSIYIGSSLCTASEPGIMRIFGVSETAAALGLSLYVIGYGVGPLLFAPLSEIPAIGRNPPYIYTYIIFVALCVATALVNNFGGLLVLRFLLGFFGSPALANAGASYGDFFGGREMPYVIALWGGGATLSPVRN
jgi:DHA1 family multidrug resistance protein-like MFS transporter